MNPTIYLPVRHYSATLLNKIRGTLWKVDFYQNIFGIFAADLVVPMVKHWNIDFLDNLVESHNIDLLVDTPEQTVKLYLSSGEEAVVEIHESSPFEVERKTSGSMDTEVRKTYRPTFDFETL